MDKEKFRYKERGMKVILSEEIVDLGEEGDIIDVSNGYARNYLLPSNKAVVYNAQNKAILESQYKAIEKRRSVRQVAYMKVQERINTISLTIKMKTGESGHLFGSVTAAVIVEHLKEYDIEVSKKQVIIPNHSIKEIGEYDIEIRLLTGVTALLHITVEDIDGKVTLDSVSPQSVEVVDDSTIDDESSSSDTLESLETDSSMLNEESQLGSEETSEST